jgi:ubiquinone/menaquinone biosynthesis C-methylase UbiE
LEQWQRIVNRIGEEGARKSLFVEIGSGMGLFVLAGNVMGFRIIGIEAADDRYQASLRIAHRLFIDNDLSPLFIQAFAELLPLPDASIDVVVSFQTLEHVTDVAQTLCEIRRILKPGGLFFGRVPNYASFYEAHYGVFFPLSSGKAWLKRYLRLWGRPVDFLDHLQWLTPAELRTLLVAAGFTTSSVTKVISTVPINLPITTYSLPFRFRRGAITNRLARVLALLSDRFNISTDHYPQIEIWAYK